MRSLCRELGSGLRGLPADRMIHVGDHALEDLKGATAAGMPGLLLDRSGRGGDGSLSRLTELVHRVREAWL